MPEEHGLSSSGFKHSRYASTRLKKAGSYRRNSDPALSITAATNRRDSLQPRSSMDDTRGKKSGTTHLMPPLTDKAREGGTWGRSASSDVPRGGSMERFVINDPTLPFGDEKKKKDKSRPPTGTRGSGKERRGSFSKM